MDEQFLWPGPLRVPLERAFLTLAVEAGRTAEVETAEGVGCRQLHALTVLWTDEC
jgi:hypothetical protein